MKKIFLFLSCILMLFASCSKNEDVENPFGTLDTQQPDTSLIGGVGVQDFLFDANELYLTDHANIIFPDRPIKDDCLIMHVEGVKAVADNNNEMHSALCLEYGVKLFSDSLRLAQSKVDGFIGESPLFSELADLPTYTRHFIGIAEHLIRVEVITVNDWDASHPAGTALNDMIRVYALNHAGFMKALAAGQPDWYAFENGGFEGLLSEMRFDSNGLYDARIPLIFLVPPAKPGLYPITVRATLANGKMFENTVVMDWTKNNIHLTKNNNYEKTN